MFNTVIIDDDLLTQEALKDLIEHNFKDFRVVGIFSSVKESLEELPAKNPDLVLLDMELGDGQGFDVLRQLEEINFEVIVTTMHDSYMMEAIKHSALDYLLKPISKTDLSSALDRLKLKMSKMDEIRKSATTLKTNRLIIPQQNGLILLNIDDVVRLESDGAYTRFYLSNGESHLASKNLGYYESQLQHHDFFRIHHKHLISMNHIKTYLKVDGGVLLMKDNSSVEISRRKKEEFLRKLGV